MKITSVLLGLATVAACAPGMSVEMMERDSEELPLGQLEWSGSLYPGGPVVKYAGDGLDDIDAQVQKDYPGLSIYDAPGSEDDEVGSSPVDESPETHIQARSRLMPRNNYSTNCAKTMGVGRPGGGMNDVANKVRKAGGTCSVPRQKCVVAACYKDAGAAICNTNKHTITPSCNMIADMIRDIVRRCLHVDCPLWTAPGKSAACPTIIFGHSWSSGRTWRVRAGECPGRKSWDH